MNTSAREISSIRFYEIYTQRTIWNKLSQLYASQWRTRAEIEEIQISKLKRLLCHAFRNVPYYTQKFRASGFDPNKFECLAQLEDIPVTTKTDLSKNPDSLKSKTKRKPGGFFDSTGGSSGQPTRYYVSGESAGYRAARDILFRKWYSFNIGNKKALLWGAKKDLYFGNRFMKYLKQLVYNTIELNAWSMTKSLMMQFLMQICRFKPNILEAYAKALLVLTDYAIEIGETDSLHIPIIMSAETISINDRNRIEIVADGLWNRYGSREFGAIAQECSVHDGMHIASECLVVESMHNSHPPNSLLITDLDNFDMPLIRYEIGDCGKLENARCKCGRNSPRIEHVDGRIDDFVKTRDGRFVDGTMFGMHLRYFDTIQRYQVIQDAIDEMTIYLELRKSLTPVEEAAILRAFGEFLGADMIINLVEVDHLAIPESGKFRGVISKI